MRPTTRSACVTSFRCRRSWISTRASPARNSPSASTKAWIATKRARRSSKICAQRGLLVKEEPYRHAVAVSERTGDVIEPLLSLQWFVKMKPLAEPALTAYHDGRLQFVPERYGRTYEQWLENIRDWNISRQLWWGHQLPVWYTPAATSSLRRRKKKRSHGRANVSARAI